jgi:hypothetical protein
MGWLIGSAARSLREADPPFTVAQLLDDDGRDGQRARQRMGLARELLDTTHRTISSIAQQVGYPDPLCFSRQFRRIHPMSPSEYRSRDAG